MFCLWTGLTGCDYLHSPINFKEFTFWEVDILGVGFSEVDLLRVDILSVDRDVQ